MNEPLPTTHEEIPPHTIDTMPQTARATILFLVVDTSQQRFFILRFHIPLRYFPRLVLVPHIPKIDIVLRKQQAWLAHYDNLV